MIIPGINSVVPFVQNAPSLAITNILPVNYELSVMGVGVNYYIDRSFTTQTIPAEIDGKPFIRTANNDKSGGSVSFDINIAADVYVAFDSRYSPHSWLDDFVLIGAIQTSDVEMDLYKKNFAAGSVSLGANFTGSMYFVIISA